MIAKTYAHFFETLKEEDSIEMYEKYFDSTSTFTDPFQKVKGVDAIFKIFQRMYRDLYDPIFTINEVVTQNTVAYIRWTFSFSFSENKKVHVFEGISRVEFSSDGKVLKHQDYWDAAEHVYEHMPLIGSVLRFIKKRIKAHHDG